MLFALICTDKPDHLALRQSTREAHLAFLNGLGAALKAAGPFLDDDGKPSGSLVILGCRRPLCQGRLVRERRHPPMGLADQEP